MRGTLVVSLVAALTCAGCGAKGEGPLRDAADEALDLAQDRYAPFKLNSEHLVEAGTEDAVKVMLEQEHCYRFIAVTASAGEEDVSLSFKHSEQVVEMGTDFLDMSGEDEAARKRKVVWGLCVWPALAGELSVYSSVQESGGAIVVLEAPVKKLGWKDGKDVRSWLKAQGDVDVEALEREDVTPVLEELMDEDASSMPQDAQHRMPLVKTIVGTTDHTWQDSFEHERGFCYHLLVKSPNCILKYEVTGEKLKKPITDDGAPQDVGRYGWSHDFCPPKKVKDQQATLAVQMQMLGDEYDRCWMGVSVHGWDASKKEAIKINKSTKAAQKKIKGKVNKCHARRKKCEKGCVVKVDGK